MKIYCKYFGFLKFFIESLFINNINTIIKIIVFNNWFNGKKKFRNKDIKLKTINPTKDAKLKWQKELSLIIKDLEKIFPVHK